MSSDITELFLGQSIYHTHTFDIRPLTSYIYGYRDALAIVLCDPLKEPSFDRLQKPS